MGFGLTTASPMQRAVCRIADGRPLRELRDLPALERAMGCPPPERLERPLELGLLSGIRVFKSLFAACLADHWSQTCQVSHLGAGEVPRVSIVSTSKDNADVVFAHVVGRLQAAPLLKHHIIGEPTSDSIMVRHPTGRPVEIKVVAGTRAGHALVSRWSAGCIFDEFPRMVGGEEGVVNWDDMRAAVLLRLLPGAGLFHIGSPWAADGPAYDMVAKHLGKPTRNLVVLKSPAYEMNPVWWTPERCAEAKERDPSTYRTDVEAEFASPDEALFPSELVAMCLRGEQGFQPGLTYVASMDPATRGNGWTLGVFCRQGKMKRMVLAREWVGTSGEPLSPRAVMRDIARELKPYGVTRIDTDQYYIDALQDFARDNGLALTQVSLTSPQRTERYLALRAKMGEGEVELVEDVRTDLVRLRKRISAQGVTILLPESRDGRHCDYAPVIILGLGRWLKDEIPADTATPESKEAARMLRDATKRWAKPKLDSF